MSSRPFKGGIRPFRTAVLSGGLACIAASLVVLIGSPKEQRLAAQVSSCTYTLTTMVNTPILAVPYTPCTGVGFGAPYTGTAGGKLVTGATSFSYTPPLNYAGLDDVHFSSSTTGLAIPRGAVTKALPHNT